MSEVKIVHKEADNSFLLMLDDENIGEIDYKLDGVKMRLMHTGVNNEHGGKGYAKLLLDYVIGYARENNLKIIPICPYVVKAMRNKEFYKDILYSERNKD